MNLSKARSIVFILATGGLLTLLMILLANQPAHAAGPWYVAPGGYDGNDCLSPGTACASINGALAKPGFVISDTILVATGTYTGSGDEVVLLDKDAILSGGWDAAFTTQSGTSTLDGEDARRGMTVNISVTAIVECFTMQGGSTTEIFDSVGGGIFNEGTLTLNSSTVSGNAAERSGGGIFSYYAILTLNNSTVSGNTAGEPGGGININRGTVTLSNSTVSGNVVTGGDGGGIRNYEGTLTLTNSTVSGNAAPGVGGGISNDRGTVLLNDSIISGNTANERGGGLVNKGYSTLNNSTVSGNAGGGILNDGTLTLNDSTISSNALGGIYVNGGTVTLSNSTVSGNWSSVGGGIYARRGTTTLIGSTVSVNWSSAGGGIFSDQGSVNLGNTLVAGNTAGDSPDCRGTITSSGYNLIGDTTGCTFTAGTGDLTNVDANLGPLIGSPGYHPLLSGSPAIDAVPLDQCPLATDQRGVARPQGPACDIGAYEYTAPGPAVSISPYGGTSQYTPPFFAFGTPLQALVLDSIGTPVSNTLVTFRAPENGASGTFADTGTFTTTAVTDEGGLAIAATLTANGIEGSYIVTAMVGGIVTPASFHLGNIGWYVAPTGDDANDCQAPATPCATINGALAKADSPAAGTVFIASGTYFGTGDEVVLLDKSTTLSGGWDAGFTTQSTMSAIDGQGLRHGIIVKNGVTAILERITVQNGSRTETGPGLSGGGIFSYGTLTLNDCSVSDNSAVDGGGVNNVGFLTLNNSTVNGNTASSQGGGIRNEAALTANNTSISGNDAGFGGGIYNVGGSVTLNNCTVSGNGDRYYGGGIDSAGGNVTLQNTILAGNTADNGPDCRGATGSLGYNLIGDTSGCTFTPGVGDLTNLSPRLGELIGVPGTPRYHPLLSDSPAIDAGNPAGCIGSTGPLTTDQRGVARVGRCDIGAYEFTTPGPAASIHAYDGIRQYALPGNPFGVPLKALVLDAIGSPANTVTVTFSAPASGASGSFADSMTHTTTAQTDDSSLATAATFTANAVPGSYTVTASVSGVPTSAEFWLTNVLWYVAPGGSDSNDCLSPTTACATINGAMDKPAFVEGDPVRVAAGLYTGTGDHVVTLDKDVTLSGGWDDTFTEQTGTSVIDGEDMRVGIVVDSEESEVTAVVEHFRVQNGFSEDAWGGGIRNRGTLILNNCTVSGNSVGDGMWGCGGGIFNFDGTLILNNSTVSGNTADECGGGIIAGGTLTLTNSTVSGNTTSGDGGGIWVGGTVTLINSTVSRNTASGNGGGINNDGDTVTLQNSILAGNTASETGLDCFGTIGSSGYNLIGDTSGCGFAPTTGDLLNVDARLVYLGTSLGYLPLRPDSPAIDAGNPAGCTDHLGEPLTTDQRGSPRPLDGDGDGVAICDMGSYEYDPDHPISRVFLPICIRAYCPDFFDDFSNPASGWEVMDDAFVRTEYLKDEYRILTKQAGYFYLFRAPTCDRQNYVVEVDARWVGTPGSSYGLIFGVTSGFSRYYLFDMNTDYQQFRLMRRDPGGFTALVSPTYSAAIKGGTSSNHLRVTRSGSRITLEVNGTVLRTLYDGAIGGLTGAGLVTNPYSNRPSSDARFDNFSITKPPGSAASAQGPSGVMAGESEFAESNAWRVPVPIDMGW